MTQKFVKRSDGYYYAPPKDPDNTDYRGVDWTADLGSATISVSAWTVPAGLTKGAEFIDAGKTYVFLSGGVAGTTYELKNRITTSDNRILEQSFKLEVKQA